jgi:protein-L-isoaspartate(D-aspartate) O-methyltransferase
MKTVDMADLRHEMVEDQVRARGVRDALVIKAMNTVPREAFVPKKLQAFAYEDSPLPIAAGQTISQPYIVAFMIEALALKGGERVLEIGTGSGYAAAVLGEIASEVYTVERIERLADQATMTLDSLGCHHVHVRCGDGTLGWPEQAPFDAIIVAAGAPAIPESLQLQLKVGGRMVIPVGNDLTSQELIRISRKSQTKFKSEDIADVRFVPLIGEEGWHDESDQQSVAASTSHPARLEEQHEAALSNLIADFCEPFDDIETADLSRVLNRIGDARVVLIGESSHGTSQFYQMREVITRALIENKNFSFVGIEGDWPDVARIDQYVRHFEIPSSQWTAFARFPTWLWRNREVVDFVQWLRNHNADRQSDDQVAMYGLDLYSLHRSIGCVLDYLREVDPETAKIASQRYGCLTPWQSDPATYGHAAITGAYKSCEQEVVKMLLELLSNAPEYTRKDGDRFMNAVQNAKLVASAEKYYRIMYYGSRASWNLRDSHMFATLNAMLDFHGQGSKAVIWAHNSHLGNAGATDMSYRGEINIGQLCREQFGDKCYAIGMATHAGSVTAAAEWGGACETMEVLPSLPGSYERVLHDSKVPNFFLPLRDCESMDLHDRLSKPRLERAIGVIYKRDTERDSHYFNACLPDQFDELIWFDETSAVKPLKTTELAAMPDTYPFGL